MPIDVPQISFGGGIISPATFARIELEKFSSAAKTLNNFFVRAEGGISNRAGFEFIKEVKDSNDTVRLIPFEFNEEQTYVLEFGDLYMRVYQDAGVVLETGINITGATQANPIVITVASHTYSNGDQVYISDVGGMTALNGKFYTVGNVTGTTFWLTGVDGTGYDAYTSGGTTARVYTLETPYLDSDLANLKFRQSNDVMYLTNTSYAPRKLTRTGSASWTLTEIEFEPEQTFPTAQTVTVNTTGSETDSYIVTAVAGETAEESLAAVNNSSDAISGATRADPVVITATGHSLSNGDEVAIASVAGMIEINDRRFVVANSTTHTFELQGENGTSYGYYSSGGTARKTFVTVTNSAVSTDNTISWTAAAGASSYNVYKDDNGLYGFIGSTENTSFLDENIAPDLSDTAPKWRQPFATATNYPGAVGLHEQRSVWGNTTTDPLTTWMSQTSQFENMNVSSPTRAADAVTIRLVTGRGNEIRHFRSFQDRLFILTSGAVWSLSPGGDVDAITPSSKKLTIEEYLSSTDVPPLTIKSNLLLVSGQANLGFEVHSLGYRFETDAYAGSDLTVLARHLFEGHTIGEWAYAERPFRLVTAVRDDGKVLVMTYLQEHQIFAWTIWEAANGGTVESVCSVPEGQEDAIYFVVKRTINGSDVKYIERLHSRTFTTIEDAFFVDSGLSLDNPVAISTITNTNPAVVTTVGNHTFSDGDYVKLRDVVNMTEVNGDWFRVCEATANTFELLDTDGMVTVTGATQANPGVITTGAAHGLTTGDEVGFLGVGGMTNLNGNGYTVTVIDTTSFSIGVNTSAFTAFTTGGNMHLNTNTSTYSVGTGGAAHLGLTAVTGLDHLEGQSVIALADGNLVEGLTVSGGAVTFADRASVFHIGLPYDAQFDSLPLDLPTQVPTLAKKKIVKNVVVRVHDTRGLFIGPNATSLEEFPARTTELWGNPAATVTDLIRLSISDDWAREAGVTIKSEHGLPMTILSVMADTDVGA